VAAKEHVTEHDGVTYKVYRITGQLYFASTSAFTELFDVQADPDHVMIDFKNAHVWDHSAVEALAKVKGRYEKAGKEVHVIGLNRESSDVVLKLYEDMMG